MDHPIGFTDSKSDVPKILTEEYAQNCAKAIVEVIAKRAKLTKRATATKAEPDALYRVQIGAFAKCDNADKLKAELMGKGYPAYVLKG